MLQALVENDAWRALLAGLACGLVYEVAAQVQWWARRWLDAQSGPRAYRLRSWHGWPALGQMLAVFWTIGFAFVGLVTGVLAARDVGLVSLDWSVALTWGSVVVGLGAIWLAALWGIHWLRVGRASTSWRVVRGRGLLAALAASISHEGYAAIARAAWMPLLGDYWGVWAAVMSVAVLARLNPSVAGRLAQRGQRELVLLDWALLWLTAALYVLVGNVLVLVVAHWVCAFIVGALATALARRKPKAADADGEASAS